MWKKEESENLFLDVEEVWKVEPFGALNFHKKWSASYGKYVTQ